MQLNSIRNRLRISGFIILLIVICGSCNAINSPTLTGIKSSSSTPVTQAAANSTPYKSELKVHFLDVGQADCIFIELPNGQNMLVDSGNNADEATIKHYLSARSVTKLDYFITTHPHEDHIGSADAVVSSFEIGVVYAPKVSTNTKTFENFLNAVKKKGMKIKAPEAGSYILNDNNKLSVQVLAPINSDYEELNDYSIVLKLKYGNVSFLLEGDAESVSENEMIAGKYELKADVLKVGHHGSTSSTSQAFLDKVNPQYAVISVGKDNDYGHPAQETLTKLSNAGVQVYRTDKSGTIIFTSDSSKIYVAA